LQTIKSLLHKGKDSKFVKRLKQNLPVRLEPLDKKRAQRLNKKASLEA